MSKPGDAAPVTRAPINTGPAFPRSAMVAYLACTRERGCLGVKEAPLTHSPVVQLWAHTVCPRFKADGKGAESNY